MLAQPFKILKEAGKLKKDCKNRFGINPVATWVVIVRITLRLIIITPNN